MFEVKGRMVKGHEKCRLKASLRREDAFCKSKGDKKIAARLSMTALNLF